MDYMDLNSLTALDWFLIVCYLFLFASMIQFALVHYFTKVFLIIEYFIM